MSIKNTSEKSNDLSAEAIAMHHHTGGSTFNVRGENLVGRHLWAVGAIPEASSISDRAPTTEEHKMFIEQHRDLLNRHPNTAVGTYYNPRTGLHHMEVVAVSPHKESVLHLATSLGEDNIHGLASHEVVHTGAQRPDFIAHSPEERLSLLHKSAPVKSPYHGTHYSNSDMDTIDGNRRGMPDPKKGSAGAESTRLRLGSQTGHGPDAPPGFYVHDAHTLPDSGMSTRPYAHTVKGSYAFGSTAQNEFKNAHEAVFHAALLKGSDAKTAHGLGLNAGEHALRDAGYDGYYSPNRPTTKFLFGSYSIDKHEYAPGESSTKVK